MLIQAKKKTIEKKKKKTKKSLNIILIIDIFILLNILKLFVKKGKPIPITTSEPINFEGHKKKFVQIIKKRQHMFK